MGRLLRASLAALAASFFGASAVASGGGNERVERGALVLENVPSTPPRLAERLLQYQNTRGASFLGFPAEGGGIFIATRFGETNQVHRVDQPLAARRQLTFYREPVGEFEASPSASPSGPQGFVFARDVGGDENFQIYRFDEREGVARLVSDGQGRKGAPIWSDDAKTLAWYTTLEGSTRAIVTAPAADPSARRVVFRKDAWMAPSDFSSNAGALLIYEYVSANESRLYRLDLETGAADLIDAAAQAAAKDQGRAIFYGPARFSEDDRSVYFVSDQDGEFASLYRYDLETGKKSNLTPDIPWGVEEFDLSPDGRTVAFVVNEAGRSTLSLRSLRTLRPLKAPVLPPGIVSGLRFSPDGARIGFTLNSATSPSDVYTWSLGGRGELARWTESEVGGLDPARFIDPTLIDYPTFDAVDGAPRRIPAIVYKPEGAGPHPVVIVIHGGPEGQSRPGFGPIYQYWLRELGAAVILPNVRGSTGFGKTYATLDNGRLREDSVRDIGALLDWIATEPDLDPSRVVVYGGSYGGYMVLASMVHYGDRLAGGVDIVGISNFVTFLENTAEYRRDVRRPEYGDERDPDMRAFLEAISPLRRAAEIKQPLFVIQGLNDPRVPASEAEQILQAVRANGGEAWYMAARDEGHGFRKKSNRDAMNEAVVLFLEKVLGAQSDPAP